MRRSLVVWGWGQLAAGDRRGLAGPPAQVAAIAGLGGLAPHAAGTAAALVFLAAAATLALWALIAVHAWRRAARRRAALGATPGGGAAGLLWLTPLAVAVGAGFWLLGGSGADAGLTLDAYLADWRAGRLDSAVTRFATAPRTDVLEASWGRQQSALRNAVVRVLAGEPTAEADPDRPFDSLRWLDLGRTAGGGRSFALEIVRQETVREQIFGLLPATSRRLVAVERLGAAELRPTPIGPSGPFGPVVAWRIVRIDVAGEVTPP